MGQNMNMSRDVCRRDEISRLNDIIATHRDEISCQDEILFVSHILAEKKDQSERERDKERKR